MRRMTIMMLIIFVFSISFPKDGQAAPSVSANNAVLIEQSTGRILMDKNAHEKSSIASITKIMTAILAIESGKMNDLAKASKEAVYTEGSSIYLKEGEKMTIEDLTYGLMLRSGNDAAMAISEHIGGSMEGFVYLMNEKAEWLGMTNTHFENPHGLDSENHYSTAYDMAILMSYAMQNEEFRNITGTKSYLSDNRSYSWKNKNKLLTAYYEYCTGGKTGFTKKTGRTLVSTATKDGMDLIAVTLNAPDDWRDHKKMYEWGFEEYEMHSLIDEGKTTLKTSSESTIIGVVKEDKQFPVMKGELNKIKQQILLENEAEIKEGEKIGLAVFSIDNINIMEIPIFSEDNASEDKDNNFLTGFVTIFKQIFRLG